MPKKSSPPVSFECLIPYFREIRPLNWSQEFRREAPLEVEIGSGLGEFLIRQAGEFPQVNFLGIEQDWGRVFKTLREIKRSGVANVRILLGDARLVFERFLPPQSVQNVFCLFPCPWPKRKQEKHRLFNRPFLSLVNSRLKNRGFFKIVTDHSEYFQWIQDELPDTGFKVSSSVIPAQFNTKFERKWKEHGQHEFFELQLVKDSHQNIALQEEHPLLGLTVKTFDPERLKLKDAQGDPGIFFKEWIYDPTKKKGLVFCFVVEKDLTQPLWISIVRKKTVWRIWPLEGCLFISTPGIQRAMEMVAEQASQCVKKK